MPDERFLAFVRLILYLLGGVLMIGGYPGLSPEEYLVFVPVGILLGLLVQGKVKVVE